MLGHALDVRLAGNTSALGCVRSDASAAPVIRKIPGKRSRVPPGTSLHAGAKTREFPPAIGNKKVSALSAPRVSKREFAAMAGCDEKQVRRAVAAGKLKPDAAARPDVSLVSGR
mgnify:CR=1 FL=1